MVWTLIWSEQINIGNEHVSNTHSDDVNADEINAIVASEEAMTSITVAPESVDTGDDDDDDDDDDEDDLKMSKFAVQSAWVDGKNMMQETNHVLVYAAQTARKDRNRTAGCFIISSA